MRPVQREVPMHRRHCLLRWESSPRSTWVFLLRTPECRRWAIIGFLPEFGHVPQPSVAVEHSLNWMGRSNGEREIFICQSIGKDDIESSSGSAASMASRRKAKGSVEEEARHSEEHLVVVIEWKEDLLHHVLNASCHWTRDRRRLFHCNENDDSLRLSTVLRSFSQTPRRSSIAKATVELLRPIKLSK